MFPSPLAVWGPDGRIRQTNACFERLMGYTFAEMEGRSVFDFVHTDDRVAAAAEVQKALAVGEATGFECRVRCRDGSYRWFVWGMAAFGGMVYVGAHDITKRKLAEESARRSEEWLRFTLDTAGIGLCQRESGETRVSEQQFRLYGLEPAEEWLSRERWLQLIHPQDRERVGTEQRLAMEQSEPYDIQFRVVWPDGSIHWLLCRGKIFHGGWGARKAEVTIDITARKRAEADLEEFFNVCRSPIAILGFDGYPKRVNAAVLRISGFTAEELAQRSAIEFFHPDDRAAMQAGFQKLIAEGGDAEFECRGLRKDGSSVWLVCSATAVPDEKSIFMVAHDINERKLAEAALAEEALHRRTVFEQSRDGIVVFDESGKVYQSNQHFADMHGYSLEEMLRLHVWDWNCEFTRDQMMERLRKVKTLPPTFETRHKRKDGSLLDVEVSSTPVEFSGNVIYYGVIRDISARKRAEEALRESERRFKLIAETIEDVFWISDVETGKMVYVSPAYERIWGRTREELYANPRAFVEAAHPEDQEGLLAALELKRTGVAYEHEYRLIRPDGSVVWIWDHAFPIRDESGQIVLYTGVAKDITQRKKMEQDLRVHSEKLERSNTELERFAYVASHDLQEPLRMVASFTQLLAQRYSGRLDEKADEYIHYAVDGAKRMQQLISDLLTYSRLNNKELDPRPTECEGVVRATLANLKAAIAESGAAVEWDPLPVLMADPVQLGQLFQNLVGNAIKFRGQAPPRVHITAVDNGSHWLFSVRDNGLGIDGRHAERIFQIFQRLHTRAEYPGTGIGLAVCQKVVERHGGRIWVESQPGAGSDFRFTLPKSQTVGRTACPEQVGTESGRGSGDGTEKNEVAPALQFHQAGTRQHGVDG